MVYRIFVEKKKELAHEAKALLADARTLLGITNLSDVRVINRYDAENISEELFDRAKTTVFSEPQLDIISHEIDTEGGVVFAVEYLPGQFDQRADSAAQWKHVRQPLPNPRHLKWNMKFPPPLKHSTVSLNWTEKVLTNLWKNILWQWMAMTSLSVRSILKVSIVTPPLPRSV